MSSYANPHLYETLKSFKKKYEDLNNQLEKETESKEIIRINKELSKLEKIVEKFVVYEKELRNIDECLEIIKKENNSELIKLAQTELDAGKNKVDELEVEFQKLLIPEDPLDEKNVIIEMRSAAGGDEASIFVADLFNVYKKYSELNKWKLTIMDVHENSAGIYFLAFSLTGDKVYSKMKFESGVHRVQRVPVTEAKGRVHTSTITVSVMPEQDEIEINIEPSDLRIDVYRASGAGGQHVNKTESSVRITHLPTGIIVACQQERSQLQNRAFAMKMLRSKLWELKQEALTKELNEAVRKQVGSGSRSEKIRTYNYPQNRITDHRVSLTINKLNEIMLGGNLTEIHEVLNNDQAEKSLNEIMIK
ncbi:peptide chain release factor 1 [Candidatus Mycoplasma haematohominis]|uniref:Peptide chain release factor 1 n=1 Tax=Candidatus Mycoplasma haematohominis TaxID=1494318 RepID=A0A478FQU8_9MOLU|nr:peptide chain release factor 1 [Candidatus Mycoplasma haemohominis]GCE63324.1 peptide chain release factor 1 [Candidatus Mycoplasma haemohominis]